MIKLSSRSLNFTAPKVTRKRKTGLERVTVLTRACLPLNLGVMRVRVPFGAISRRTFYRRPSGRWTDKDNMTCDDAHIFDLSSQDH